MNAVDEVCPRKRPGVWGGCTACLKRAVEASGISWDEWCKATRRNSRRNSHRTSGRQRLALIRQDPERHAAYLAKQRAASKVRRITHGEQINAARRRYYATPEGRQKVREVQRRYYRRYYQDPAKRQTRNLAVYRWHKQHPDKSRQLRSISGQRYRARKLAASGTFSRREWQLLCAIYKQRCVYCGRKPKRLTMDHVVALVNGGAHSWENIVPACRRCNGKKGVKKAPLFQPPLPLTMLMDQPPARAQTLTQAGMGGT